MHVCGDARAWLGLAFSERHRLLVGAERVQYNRASLLYRGTLARNAIYIMSMFAILHVPMLSALSFSSTPFPSSYITLSGVRHFVRDTGEVKSGGPVVVLLHGFAGSTDAFDELAPRLAAGGCRAIAFDRVGFGRTERPVAPTLPTPPPIPEPLANSISSFLQPSSDESSDQQEGSGGGLASFLDLRRTLTTGLRRPATLVPPLPWQLSDFGESPYSTRFAVSSSLWPLLRKCVGPTTTAAARPRPIFIVGHSAGGPIALRALSECAAGGSPRPQDSSLPRGTKLAGVALIAPAALEPREDPEFFDSNIGDLDDEDAPAADGANAASDGDSSSNEASTGGATKGSSDDAGTNIFDGVPLPDGVKKRVELEARIAAFRTLVSLPDAFGLPLARRIADNRDLEAAVRAQMHQRMSAPEHAERIAQIAEKCECSPLKRFGLSDLGAPCPLFLISCACLC